jgi:hypothetical protein
MKYILQSARQQNLLNHCQQKTWPAQRSRIRQQFKIPSSATSNIAFADAIRGPTAELVKLTASLTTPTIRSDIARQNNAINGR